MSKLIDPPSESLLKQFDGPGPRYTSYPTIDQFVEAVDSSVYAEALAARVVGGLQRPLSLYVHLPFCESVCYYCACNKVVTKDHRRTVPYLRALGQEMAAVSGRLGSKSPVTQLHFGGGTPTFLTDDELEALVLTLEQTFPFLGDTERSIEVDPRTVTPARIGMLRATGFNRLSFGIQDFDPAVQQAVHRQQSFASVEAVMVAARDSQFHSINVDLIYGLPLQTLVGFEKTLQQVIALVPDRIALYAYAHLPERFKTQRRISAEQLPDAALRVALLALAIRTLTAAGYEYIGMDHFALPQDSLAIAKRQGRLHRNFQGYTTQPDCDLIGLGASAIGRIGATYVQNARTLEEYYTHLAQGHLPTFRGHVCQVDDLIRHAVIMALMCQGIVRFSDIEETYWVKFQAIFRPELHELLHFEREGLVSISADAIEVTAMGWFLIRPIAMVFDRYARQARQRQAFSKLL